MSSRFCAAQHQEPPVLQLFHDRFLELKDAFSSLLIGNEQLTVAFVPGVSFVVGVVNPTETEFVTSRFRFTARLRADPDEYRGNDPPALQHATAIAAQHREDGVNIDVLRPG